MAKIIMDENYWDCECESQYIHKKHTNPETYCLLCEAVQSDQPDSRVNEIRIENLAFSHLTVQPEDAAPIPRLSAVGVRKEL